MQDGVDTVVEQKVDQALRPRAAQRSDCGERSAARALRVRAAVREDADQVAHQAKLAERLLDL